VGWIKSVVAGAWASASLILLANPAIAANTPQVGPVPTWVRPPPATPIEKDDLKGLPVVILFHDAQLSFDADGWTEYHEVTARVQTPEGLQALNTISYQWSPWSDTLTFHRAVISRDGQTIDILPKDGAFTVLRRETGLEQAMLTGELTTLLQPEGLQVGDTLDVAISIHHADPLLKGRSAALFANWDTTSVGQMRLQAHWPSSLPVKWRETPGLPPLRRTEAGGVTTVELDMDDVRPPILPAHAPVRFRRGRQVEFTTFSDWKAVAQVMAPLYAKGAELGPQSAVAAQAALIAKTSADPKQRAAAALRLVQGHVRYLAHAEDGGGLMPQSADETWRLRYGDCKAKTVLLMALLRELGVPAEPVLASVGGGDGLNAYLPAPQLFNHVLVRVRLGGRDYWLDGTRESDRGLDDLATPGFGWVLPLDSPDGQLIRLDPSPPSRPQISQVIRYDASGGVTAPEPTQLETTIRDDVAVALHAKLSAIPPERMDAALKAYWTTAHTAFTPVHVAQTWNPDTAELKLTADGTSKIGWSGAGFELQNVEFHHAADVKRDPASSDPDAPYQTEFPAWVETDESVVLPRGDALSPDRAKATDVDTTIAGVAYRRKGTVTGNVFRVAASMRALKPEISAAEARASVDPLTKLGAVGVYAAAGSRAQEANDAAALDSQPTTIEGHLFRGNALLDAKRFREALKEFDAAVSLDPKSQRAWAARAVAHAWLGDRSAFAEADEADTLGPPEIGAARARGILAANMGDLEGALAAYRHALTIAPDDEFTLLRLVDLETQSSDFDAARKDLEHLLRAHPELARSAPLWRGILEAAANHKEIAEKELAQVDVATPEARLARASVYLRLGETDLARADVDQAIRVRPTAAAWLQRAAIDGGYASAAANTDADAALKLAPDDMEAQAWKADAAMSRGDFAAALPLANRLVSEHPELASRFLVARAQIEGKLGHGAEMDADFTKAHAATGDAAPDPATLCSSEVAGRWRPQTALGDCEKALQAAPNDVAPRLYQVILLHRLGRSAEAENSLTALETMTHDPFMLNDICYSIAAEGMDLDRALALCDASLKLRPNEAAILDSRAFVLFRLGRYAEALTAYDAAITAKSDQFESLYGRGLAEARLGRAADSTRDIAAALKGRPRVREEFAEMGVR
jgi:tetratricopeptide (TPR) repeat protein